MSGPLNIVRGRFITYAPRTEATARRWISDAGLKLSGGDAAATIILAALIVRSWSFVTDGVTIQAVGASTPSSQEQVPLSQHLALAWERATITPAALLAEAHRLSEIAGGWDALVALARLGGTKALVSLWVSAPAPLSRDLRLANSIGLGKPKR